MVRPVDAGRVHRRSVPGRACHPLTFSERRDGDDHRRRRPPGDGRNRHAPGHPCGRGAGFHRRPPGRRVIHGQRGRISKAPGVDGLVRSGCPCGGRGDRRLRCRSVALPAPQRCRGHRGGPGQPPSPTPGREVRSGRRRRGGPSRPVRPSPRVAQDPGWQRRSHPCAACHQTFVTRRSDQDAVSDPSSVVHRAR